MICFYAVVGESICYIEKIIKKGYNKKRMGDAMKKETFLKGAFIATTCIIISKRN